LDRYLAGGALLGVSVAVTFGALDVGLRAQLRAASDSNHERLASLGDRLANLARNQGEMTALRREAPVKPGYMQLGRRYALLGLSDAVPDALTLTALSIGKDNGFEIEAVVVGADFDSESLRLALARRGFRPDDKGGWAFDAASGRLSVRGRYVGPQT
jgi:hypothetical protein